MTNNLNSHKGNANLTNRLHTGADRNRIAMIVQANVAIDCDNIVVVLNNTIHFFCNQSIQCITFDHTRCNIELSGSCVCNRNSACALSECQEISIANVVNRQASFFNGDQTVLQSISVLILMQVLSQIAQTNILYICKLSNILKILTQLCIISESNILRFLDSVAFDTRRNAASNNRIFRLVRLFGIIAGSVAASQHGDSHDTGQHQRSNLLSEAARKRKYK